MKDILKTLFANDILIIYFYDLSVIQRNYNMRQLILLGICALGFTACSKDYAPLPVDEDIRNPFQGTFEYTLNDEVFKSEIKDYTFFVDDNDVTSLLITATKFSDDKEPLKNDIIALTIPYYEGTRTYDLNDYIAGTFTQGSHLYEEPYDAADIKIHVLSRVYDLEEYLTISSDGDLLKGAFDFKMIYIDPADTNNRDTLHFQNGSFEIPK